MKKSKILLGALAFSMLGMMAPINAASGVGDTDVSYTSDSNIPDPDNPTDPHWAVSIPSSIVFTSSTKTADATVELKAMNGYDLPSTGTITVSVVSKNSYGLYAAGADKDIMPYSLKYGSTKMTSTTKTVGELIAAADNKIAGTAELSGTAVAKVKGSHSDTLTYTIETATP